MGSRPSTGMLSLLLLYAIFSGLSSLFLLGNCEETIFILAKATETMVWHFSRSVIYEILEGIPETVGGLLSLGESAVAISAGRRAGLFLLPLLIWTDGRWLHWIVLLHFVICWKSERFWFLWQHLSLHCARIITTVITRRQRNNRPSYQLVAVISS